MLNTLQIKSAKPENRPFKISDSGGLYLLVQPNGSKLWRYKFRLHGKEGLQALGAFPEVGLAEAREKHVEARKLVAQGIHPVQAQQDKRRAQAVEQLTRETGTFEAVVRAWNEATEAGLRPGTIAQRRREIGNDLLPRFKGRQIDSVTRLEITAALKATEKRAPEVARNVRSYLFGIFEHAIDSGLIESNPVPPQRILKKRSQTHHAALSKVEIKKFFRQLHETELAEERTRTAMLLVLLTVSRKVEVIGARWSEFNLETLEWEIPATRMKAGRPHWVPLSRQAAALVAGLRKTTPEGQEFLFPNRRDPKRPMAGRSLNALMDRFGYSDKGTPHGMRSAFSTHFNGIGTNPDVVEHCLAHVPANRVRSAYNRHEYRDERRAVLQQWADHLDYKRPASSS